MANPQPDRYTKIANELLEQVPKFKFNGTQLRIILVVWRYTYGFSRKSHEFSLNFLAEATDAGRSQVDRELTALIDRNVLKVISGNPGKPRVLQFNKNYEEWDNVRCPRNGGQLEESGVLQNRDTLSSALGTEVSSALGTKKRKKETLKKGDIYMSKIKFLDTVYLTQEEHDRLINEFGKETVDLFIEKLDEWQTNYPKKAKKDHNKTIRVWIRTEQARQKQFAGNRLTAKQAKNKQEMDILNQFYQEGEAIETNGNGKALGSGKDSLS